MGRVAAKLVALLEAEGFSGVRIYAAQGRDRSDPKSDIYRWSGHAFLGTVSFSLHSWDTMTACVRYGICKTKDERTNTYDIALRRRGPP